LADINTLLLAIESSCDDSSIALLRAERLVHSKTISQQHQGGVLPEHAARTHVTNLWNLINTIPCDLEEIGAIAVTSHPGLIGSLRVGVTIAKTLAWTLDVPLVGVNHVDAHILTPLWCTDITTPYLALVISGGHTLLAEVVAYNQINIIGTTCDDAVGEAFDKTARMLGLPYPGGPALERHALGGTPRFKLPIPMRAHHGYDFSFSGFKEHVRQRLDREPATPTTSPDWAASIQHSLTHSLIVRTKKALQETKIKRLAIVGGVAANQYVRRAFQTTCDNMDVGCFVPPPHVCGDNAEMIAWAGLWQLQDGRASDLGLTAQARYGGGPHKLRSKSCVPTNTNARTIQ
jgi:N6-L-threonylcarbamoyladenine synthase